MQRLGAVVPDTNRNPLRVEVLADVVRVNPVDGEGHKADSLDAVVGAQNVNTVQVGDHAVPLAVLVGGETTLLLFGGCVQRAHLGDGARAEASLTYGGFTSLVYMTGIAGGFVADRILGEIVPEARRLVAGAAIAVAAGSVVLLVLVWTVGLLVSVLGGWSLQQLRRLNAEAVQRHAAALAAGESGALCDRKAAIADVTHAIKSNYSYEGEDVTQTLQALVGPDLKTQVRIFNRLLSQP